MNVVHRIAGNKEPAQGTRHCQCEHGAPKQVDINYWDMHLMRLNPDWTAVRIRQRATIEAMKGKAPGHPK